LSCRDYLLRVPEHDPGAIYQAITQNHLPSAGGSLLHPHLQRPADPPAANHQQLPSP
jgi:galactose-1-phosphate uridylyltransferase